MSEFDLIWTDEEKQEAEKEAYNQALEDFVKAYKEKSSMENKLVDTIAEQLKR